MPGLGFEKTVDKARIGLRKIQRAGGRTKRFYLVLLSSLAMVVVVGLWFSYLNMTLPAPPGREAEKVEVVGQDSFFEVFIRGANKIFEDFKNQFAKIGESLGRVKEFSFEGKEINFVPASSPPLAP
jgi:hypothetical protein